MKLAILIDAGYYRAQWQKRRCRGLLPSALDIRKTIVQISESVQARHRTFPIRLLRTYYYDAEPYEGTRINPDGEEIVFLKSAQYQQHRTLLNDLSIVDNIAIRKGRLKFRGWDSSGISRSHKPLFTQKGVDMKIGLDVAWLSTKRIVDIIVLVTADTDFIAPMKLARTEGVEVWLYTLDGGAAFELVEHADVSLQGTLP